MQRITDMTCGKPAQLIFFFSLPLMLGGVFQQLYMIVDTIIVGRGVGIHALASLGAADWINWMVLWAIHGFTHGFSVLIAQEFGAGRPDALRKVTAMIVKLCIVFGVLLTAASLFAVQPLLVLLHTENTVIGARACIFMSSFRARLLSSPITWRRQSCAALATAVRRCPPSL